MAEENNEKTTEKIIPRVIEDEMKKAYLSYAMSVIVGRALPDVRDGLKPVHRRILFAMNDLGMRFNQPYKKCARIVGEVLGKYHPHGDSAVYDSLVRMAQSFSLRYMLIDGQGNFGSIDGDNPAAMRYTEARMSKLSDEMMQDIDKETVDFAENFDGSLKEPVVLPSKLPNLLINGSSGIAVGMATNIPPHNLKEISQGVIALIDNPEISVTELMEFIQAPDFPTGGVISGRNGIISAYATGRGKIIVKGVIEIEEKGDKQVLIVKEIPYMVNKSVLVEEIANGVHDKKIEGISDLRDESDKDGIRIVVELKKSASTEIVINQLFKYTKLSTTFGIIMIALVNGEPKVLTLKEVLENYLAHRVEVVKKRTQFELTKSEKRAHVLEGLLIALKNVDAVIKLIRASDSAENARSSLIENYSLSLEQASAILDLKLQKLAKLESLAIETEHRGLLETITELKGILASEQKILDIIKGELEYLIEKYGDDRRTAVVEGEDLLDIEDLIEEEDMVVTITHEGYIKRMPIETYKLQKRGGKGVIGTSMKEEDFVEDVFIANTHSYLLIFTNKGKVHWVKVYKIPDASRQSRGRPVINLINVEEEESVRAVIPIREFNPDNYLVTATKNGIVKKTSLEAYSRPRNGGIIALTLAEKDQLVDVKLTDGNKQLLLATKHGFAVKFDEKDARSIGRTSMGVKGVTLRGDDELIGMVIADDKDTLLTITEHGYGKKTPISDYRLINRGGKGVINIKTTDRNGGVVAIKAVNEDDELIFISKHGIVIRTSSSDISTIGRNTQGVRLMRMKDDDRVVSAAKIVGSS
jgi:DNA gyrase subunit A